MAEANRNCSGFTKEMGIGEEDDLKRRISSHPLYERLVRNHLDCLQVSGINISVAETNEKIKDVQKKAYAQSPHSGILEQEQSELDMFMEAYCAAQSKLKEAIEEPQQQTIAFLNSMHSQLTKLSCTTNPQPADAPQETDFNDKMEPE